MRLRCRHGLAAYARPVRLRFSNLNTGMGEIVNRYALFTVMAFTTACGGYAPPEPSPHVQDMMMPPPMFDETGLASLFPGDAEVLSDSAIRRILNYEMTLPSQVRIAVFEMGSRWGYRRWWSEETARSDTHVTDTLLTTLMASQRVTIAAVLPMLLIPEKHTVPYLREAAARFQADLLLVYQPTCAAFQRSRFLAADQFRVTCTVEAVALDTQSGIVPLSAFRTRTLVVQRQGEDFNEQDMMSRAQFMAVAEAIAAVGEVLVDLVESIEVR